MSAPRPVRDRAAFYRRAMNLPEVVLWRAIKSRKLAGLHFRRQHPIGPYILDFYCHAARLAVEVDGQGHGFGDRPDRDARRDAWLLAQGVRTLRIPASTVLEDVNAATGWILNAVGEEHVMDAQSANPRPIGAVRRWTSPRGGGPDD
ncbi:MULTISPECIES: endonuclease domain-containing protein [unclassified Phenylobacterium]|jgi:very-short-patch-repair endonuclease|uniref:endonuclease domain-containing protein n=1 Tax=unclassified Phenylobacterium TaxID=2640670 RepID=UPI0009E88599|nr:MULTISPECIES: DUF559 domain-containing protein [unclassified Phenylobacterium]